jgi:hypothetical protein
MVSGYKPINKKILGSNIKSCWALNNYGMATIWKHQLNCNNMKSLLIINNIFTIPSYEEFPYILDYLDKFSNKYREIYIITIDMNLREKIMDEDNDTRSYAIAIFLNNIITRMNLSYQDIDILGLNRGGDIAVKLINISKIYSTLYLWNHIGIIPQINKPVFIGLSLKEIMKDNRYYQLHKYRTRVYDDINLDIILEIHPDFIFDIIL